MNSPEDDTPRIVQNVTATAGFAYGTIGADIHVFGNGGGAPLYVLENWQPPQDTDADWLRQLPSRMLNARHAVVKFTGRDSELDHLYQWRESQPRLSARWLYGPAGQGKTRLANQLAAQSLAEGWKVVTAGYGPGAVLPPPGSQDLGLEGFTGLLMIIDYADRWPLSHLTWLFSNALLHQVGVRTRILLIARSANAWPAVRAALANHRADASGQHLEPLPAASGERAEMFDAARDSFAARYELVNPGNIAPPGPLDGTDLGLTLAVHIAALVAVDAHATGHRAAPCDMAGLTIYLLDREQLHWANLFGDSTHELDGTGRAYRTPPAVMNQAVFAASLVGAASAPAGRALVDRLDLQTETGQVIADHAFCYPSSALDQSTVLEPLYPDLLAEDFLALTISGHSADYPSRAWAPATAAALLGPNRDETTSATAATRGIVFLASAMHRWPHVGPSVLYPLLRANPQVAIDAGSAALTAIAEAPGVEPAILEAIEALFPDDQNTDLDPGIADVVSRLANHQLSHTQDPLARARIYDHLATRTGLAGRYDEALAAAQRAIGTWRTLAQTDPLEYEPELASALGNLGTYAMAAGREEEAVGAARGSVTILRRLSETDAATYDSLLALALHNLSSTASAMRCDDAEALETAQESVAIYRRLAEKDPADVRGLSMALDSLGHRLWVASRPGEALASVQEAVQVRRPLAAANPATHNHGLASTLHNLGVCLSSAGRWEEALDAAQEAANLCRHLANANPVIYRGDLARYLATVGRYLSTLGRREEALQAAEESVEVFRHLAKAHPAAFQHHLAAQLATVGHRLSTMDRWHEALEIAREAAALYRHLATAGPVVVNYKIDNATLAASLTGIGSPGYLLAAAADDIDLTVTRTDSTTYRPQLAMVMMDLGICLSKVGLLEEAVQSVREAVTLRNSLSQADAIYDPDLATALDLLALLLTDLGRDEEALEPARESVEICGRLIAADSSTYASRYASALSYLVSRLADMERHEDAVELAFQAAHEYQQLAHTVPAFEANIALWLGTAGHHLSHIGHLEEARVPAKQAADTYRRLAQSNPAEHEPPLAIALSNLGACLAQLGLWEEALGSAQEAAEIYRRLAEADPANYAPELVTMLEHLAYGQSELGHREKALELVLEAARVYGKLAESESAYRPRLAMTLGDLGVGLAQLERWAEAMEHAQKAVDTYRLLATADPTAYKPDLGKALLAQIWILAEGGGSTTEALKSAVEAVDLYRELASLEPDTYLHHLRTIEATHAELRAESGQCEES